MMFPGHPAGLRPGPGLPGHGMDPLIHYQIMNMYAQAQAAAARDLEMKAEMEKQMQNQRNLKEQQQREREREQREQREVSLVHFVNYPQSLHKRANFFGVSFIFLSFEVSERSGKIHSFHFPR